MGQRLKQLGWFALIWALSVLTLGAIGLAIRAVLKT
jgi:hypothetical protein